MELCILSVPIVDQRLAGCMLLGYYSTFVATRTESMFPASPKDFTRRILNSNKLAFVRELSHSNKMKLVTYMLTPSPPPWMLTFVTSKIFPRSTWSHWFSSLCSGTQDPINSPSGLELRRALDALCLSSSSDDAVMASLEICPFSSPSGSLYEPKSCHAQHSSLCPHQTEHEDLTKLKKKEESFWFPPNKETNLFLHVNMKISITLGIPRIEEMTVPIVDYLDLLGVTVTINNLLNFSKHIAMITQKIGKQLDVLSRVLSSESHSGTKS
ncbi:hypothetical protein pdam_00016905 [Pocillopora damicornis]|uniref:Uncharacterized protein n=1 Tax=Pocillopora damicornis TaxID=46731 RepID=A0A3M6TMN1_POCDA|nr:hypothetical protein pdam_00016905 [Pocillopora damicornis]